MGGMSRIYEVRTDDADRVVCGTRRTRQEAEALVREMGAVMGKPGYGPRRPLIIVEIEATASFEIPPRPTPRERYSTRVQAVPGAVHGNVRYGDTCRVEILDGERVVFAYDRNYRMLDTFEPFRQDGRDYALISPNYTATSVVDLSTGTIIAGEAPHGGGFCPVGFYVPDWWDVHEKLGTANNLPGSSRWRAENEWPTGDFGFVVGCHWGDDSTMKVQYLDLSRIREGVLVREERFGYIELATYRDLPVRSSIECWPNTREVRFAVLKNFELATGRPVSDDDEDDED